MGDRERTRIVSADAPMMLLEIALNELLNDGRDPGPTSEADAEVALGIRGEAPDLVGLFLSLADSLAQDVDHTAYHVQTIRIDGQIRTDDGLAGWGYALARPGAGPALSPPTVVRVTVDRNPDGEYTMHLTLRDA